MASARWGLEGWGCASPLDERVDAVPDAAEGRTQRSHALVPRWPTDGPKLIDRWMRGKVQVHVKVLLWRNGFGAKPCQYLATLQPSRPLKVVDVEKKGRIVAAFESKLHPGFWREDEGREVQVPVLVDLPKLIEKRKWVFVRQSAMRDDLDGWNSSIRAIWSGCTPASLPFATKMLSKVWPFPRGLRLIGKALPPFPSLGGWTSVSKHHLPDEMVQSGAQVVHDVAAHDAPQEGCGWSLPAQDMYARFRIEIGVSGVQVSIDPLADFGAKGVEVSVCPADPFPNAV